MSRYYFHLREGDDVTTDCEGEDLPDRDAAAAAGRHTVSKFLGTHLADSGELMLDGEIWITDADGKVVATIPFPEALTITWPKGRHRN